MISYPFNSEMTGYDERGLPIFDRAIDASQFREWTKLFYTNGVSAAGTDFLVTADGTDMTVTVAPGAGHVEGVVFKESEQRTLQIQAADSNNDRIDTVVLRLDEVNRVVDLYVVKGTASASPVHPNLTRPSEGEAGDIYELGIADIYVPKTGTTITQERITDTRLDTSRCGVIVGAIVDLDTDQYYSQLQAMLSGYEDEFETWFATIQGILDEDTAGNLLAMIEDLQDKMESPIVTITIESTDWVDGVYTLSDSRITATSNQEFLPPIYDATEGTGNTAEIEALQSANLQDGGQSTGQAKIICMGDVPTITIHLRVIFRGEK